MTPQPLAMNPTFSVVYSGKMFQVVQWEGKPGVYFEAARRAPGTRLLIEVPGENGAIDLLMTREMRREAGGWDIRLPGGKMFDTLAEYSTFLDSGADAEPVALAAAQLEGREEAGIRGGEYKLIRTSKAGASVEWDLHYYLVTNGELGEQELGIEHGDIETIRMTSRMVFDAVSSGQVGEARSEAVLWWWLAKNGYVVFKD